MATVKKQKEIKFINECNCIVDYKMLQEAMIWYSCKKTISIKKIYLWHGYPSVSVYDKKIFVHRLIYQYYYNIKLKTLEWVHHINENKLDATITNLKMMTAEEHQSYHAKGRPLTESQRKSIREKNKKYNTKKEITREGILNLRNNGYTMNEIVKKLKCSQMTIQRRLYGDNRHENTSK